MHPWTPESTEIRAGRDGMSAISNFIQSECQKDLIGINIRMALLCFCCKSHSHLPKYFESYAVPSYLEISIEFPE